MTNTVERQPKWRRIAVIQSVPCELAVDEELKDFGEKVVSRFGVRSANGICLSLWTYSPLGRYWKPYNWRFPRHHHWLSEGTEQTVGTSARAECTTLLRSNTLSCCHLTWYSNTWPSRGWCKGFNCFIVGPVAKCLRFRLSCYVWIIYHDILVWVTEVTKYDRTSME